jgi:hypothetical protein
LLFQTPGPGSKSRHAILLLPIAWRIADLCRQNRSIPNKKSNATVTRPDSSIDPRQPNRFEKKKNIRLLALHHLSGRSTTLKTSHPLVSILFGGCELR